MKSPGAENPPKWATHWFLIYRSFELKMWEFPGSPVVGTWHFHCHIVVFVQLLSHVQLFVTPWTAVRQASLSFFIVQSSLKLISIESMMLSNNFVLCHPPFPLFLTALVWVQSLVGELRSRKPSGLTEKKKTQKNCCFKPLFWDNCYKPIDMHPMVVLVVKSLPANAGDLRHR